nr:uncharacterized protein LOC114825810 [Malus domestica]
MKMWVCGILAQSLLFCKLWFQMQSLVFEDSIKVGKGEGQLKRSKKEVQFIKIKFWSSRHHATFDLRMQSRNDTLFQQFEDNDVDVVDEESSGANQEGENMHLNDDNVMNDVRDHIAGF